MRFFSGAYPECPFSFLQLLSQVLGFCAPRDFNLNLLS